MGQVLTLDIPNEVYEPLLKKAKQAGCTPEDIVLEWLIRSMQNLTDDPQKLNKTRLLKVVIRGQHFSNTAVTHDHKTCAVH